MELLTNCLGVIWKDFVALIYPQRCIGCTTPLVKHEQYLCTRCFLNLPFFESPYCQNQKLSVYFSFLPKVSSVKAYLVLNKKGLTESILYGLKYHGNKELALLMGKHFGASLTSKGVLKADYLIPIPLHPDKEQKRGFNQSREIAKGLSEKLGIPINDEVIIRTKEEQVQSKQDKVTRWHNQGGVYTGVNVDALIGKSVILVDDVITTGATMVAVCELIGPKVSEITILALATGK
jgi:competence protein ComFC|tara:strand:- start:3385 stop:4089 length:705 start_codon:yes stop_codon:yes gene_type:complete